MPAATVFERIFGSIGPDKAVAPAASDVRAGSTLFITVCIVIIHICSCDSSEQQKYILSLGVRLSVSGKNVGSSVVAAAAELIALALAPPARLSRMQLF